MKFIKVFDDLYVQCYYVDKPSKEYLKAFPKHFTYGFRNQNSICFHENSDQIKNFVKYYNMRGYVFTTKKIDFNKVFKKTDETIDMQLNARPSGFLNKYLDKDHDFVINISPADGEEVPCKMVEDILIKSRVNDFIKLNVKGFKDVITRAFTNELKKNDMNLIEFVIKITTTIPLTRSFYAIKFPKEITEYVKIDKLIYNSPDKLPDSSRESWIHTIIQNFNIKNVVKPASYA